MDRHQLQRRRGTTQTAVLIGTIFVVIGAAALWNVFRADVTPTAPRPAPPIAYQPRQALDVSGYSDAISMVDRWEPDASLEEVRDRWVRVGFRIIEWIETRLNDPTVKEDERFSLQVMRALLHNYENEPKIAYEYLTELRGRVEAEPFLAAQALYSLIYFQGVSALRQGETANCILCRGESSCILPISPAAVHTNPEGSRLAIRHFTEYLEQFPDDVEVKWLLNLAHMTLGEHPGQVDPQHLIDIRRFRESEFDIGKFRDIGHIVGVNRFNQLGGGIMEDFDGDGRLDIAVTTFDPTVPMALYRNSGDGAFEERSAMAGVTNQYGGGAFCVQADYNNDGHVDLLVVRGAWIGYPVRPTLLKNNGNGTFTDVTAEAQLIESVNSISASWADYDNDGWLDLYVCCERQPSRLYHNLQDGTFEEVAAAAGINPGSRPSCKGAAWIDVDNDGYQDLFINYLTNVAGSQLYRNNRDGTFDEITAEAGISGPIFGFSCWAWDYDNDGWLDIFASSYDKSMGDVLRGMLGQPHSRNTGRLYRNLGGTGFEDRTAAAGLDLVFTAMGSNYGDFDNDGYLDLYLGTGDPDIATLVPNRMFRNVAGERFADITGTSGTGNLQKGHSVACGDWDRDGDVDIFIEMGGSTNGDKYHNILFQNPGQSNHWLTIKLIGAQTNRSAIGARIRVRPTPESPKWIHRTVSSGSSFGANPLQQTIGLGASEREVTVEVHWPTSGTTQTFERVPVDQAIEITEFADSYHPLGWEPIPLPQ